MHAAAIHLLPILGAEKSKVPFYIAGGVLVAWALIVSLGLGLRRPDFPGGPGGERVVIAITAALVIAAASTAVITSGTSAKTTAASASTPETPSTGSETPAVATASTSIVSPKATTGTPTPPSATASTALKLAAEPGGQLSYDTKQLAAKAGKVTITLTNTSPIEHDVAVAKGSTVLGATPSFQGGSKALTLNLKPGTYTFYCTVPGHRQAGMEGTLTVSS
jgi:plastocyanin